ncbi:MAG: AtzE family amidohydrolase [Hyphomonadaceae bacterium]|nr:AtzE family amidohydrolase [Hyphomonadaceae bacterium]
MTSRVADLADLGVREIAAEVHRNRLTAEAVTVAALDRIARLNGKLNCYTRIDSEEAIAAARATDKAIARGDDPGPLAGATFGAKDLFDIAGHTTTAGAALRANAPPAEEDAAAVSALRTSGATLLGSQNMDEFAYGFTTDNAHTGPTRNPHDITLIAGGSSGGSAAAVAAGLCAGAIGTDTNGSVRVPAAFCGVFGLKPTYTRLSRRGTFPFVHSFDHIGCFARNTPDLAALYDALQVADSRDPAQARRSADPSLPSLDEPEPDLRIATLGGYFRESATPDVLAALDAVAEALGAIRSIELPETERARSAAFCLSAAEGGSLHLHDLRTQPQLYDFAVRDRLIAGAMLPAGLIMRAQRFRRWFRDRVADIFETTDILLAPAAPFPAQPIGQPTIRMGRGDLSVRANAGLYTQPISFIGLPVVVAPLLARGQPPRGVQLIGPPWSEARLLRMARRLELAGLCVPARPSELAP